MREIPVILKLCGVICEAGFDLYISETSCYIILLTHIILQSNIILYILVYK